MGTPSAKAELTGAVLDERYRVGRRLDRGGPGGVYEGTRLANDAPVAIEILTGTHDPKRLDRAAAAAGKLEDAHCVGVLDSGIDDGRAFLVMPLVTGALLADEIKRGRMAVPRAISILRQLLRGLRHAHGVGLLHGGITPRQVVIVPGEGLHDTIRLLGFGVGKPVGHRDPPARDLVKTKALRGDPTYMAPEQARGDKIGARTDLYAVSVILFEMLAGRPPFVASEPVNVLNMHLSQAVPPLADGTGPSFVPPEIDAIVRCGLAKDPSDRPQSADEYLHALDACMAVVSARDADTTTRIGGMSQRIPRLLKLSRSGARLPAARKRSGGWGLVIALVVIGGAAAAAYLLDRRATPTSSANPVERPVGKPAKRGPTVEAPVEPVEPTVRAPAPAPAPAYAAELDEAAALVRARKYATADHKLRALIDAHPDAGDIRRELGHLYLARNWPEPTLKAYRAALARDPALREDATIVAGVISLLDSGSRFWDAQKFLEHDVGPVAIPALTDAVLTDPSPTIRNRAKAVLDKLKVAAAVPR